MLGMCLIIPLSVQAGQHFDLEEIQARGKLRHLGVVYANFVTGSGDGFSVELMKQFAGYLGVDYEYVPTTWADVIPDLIGRKFHVRGNAVDVLGQHDIRGDVIANGLTILPWRQKLLQYSEPIFPTQVWLVAHVEAGIEPIEPTGTTDQDIEAVKQQLQGLTLLGKKGTCLDPDLYALNEWGARSINFAGQLNQLAPAVINKEAEATILDVPDALIALQKWSGKVKIIGPISHQQNMGVGFRKTSPQLHDAFHVFLQQFQSSGAFLRLIQKYYPNVLYYYPEFFE